MKLANKNITELVRLCKQDNQRAQLELYNRYYKAMYNTSLRIVKDTYVAEDIMQESFLSAFSKMGSLKEDTMFGAWLKRIVTNNSIHYYKKQAEYTDVALDDVLYKIEDESNDGISQGDTENAKVQQVLKSMNYLKPRYRIGLTLHLIEGYDYEEISEIMDISYANCRTMISRAKDSLRKKLQPSTPI